MEYRMVLIDGDALVVVFDMCSSSDVLEELTLSGDLWRYDELLTSIKEYLANAQGKVLFDPYKFTGGQYYKENWCSCSCRTCAASSGRSSTIGCSGILGRLRL